MTDTQELNITIKARHLIGNTYAHALHTHRMCPLQEALNEIYSRGNMVMVCSAFFYILNYETKLRKIYNIDTTVWNEITVRQYIKDAENGDKKDIILTFKKSDNISIL